MKKNSLSFYIGILLLLLFLAPMFCFQVRTTESAVVTTFGSYSAGSAKTEPGLYFRLPPPIQKVYKFDNRLRNFERKFETTTTKDGKNLLITVYVGWSITDPKIFLERLNGDPANAEQSLEGLVRNAKNAVVGMFNFSDLVSADPTQAKFDAVEDEMLKAIKDSAKATYGVGVKMVGIKQLGLPESITGKVFERMRAERERLVKKYTGEGQSRAIEIKSEADRKRSELLAEADADSLRMKGDAEAAAAPYYKVLEQDPQLAHILLELNALRDTIKDKTTLILDENTPPYDLLRKNGPLKIR
jgi:modulator of FtsH protease HflC